MQIDRKCLFKNQYKYFSFSTSPYTNGPIKITILYCTLFEGHKAHLYREGHAVTS